MMKSASEQKLLRDVFNPESAAKIAAVSERPVSGK